ncbi:MAG: sulfur carrier protein ThiS [Lachnospiraceae bacterium]|nr:sulfur carrier protein ThiS [Lachnospiraceae bacterium]
MVRVNGEDMNVAGKKLSDFLKESDYRPGTYVVECNEEIIHKEDYDNYTLKEGDVLEIVSFMGGGC